MKIGYIVLPGLIHVRYLRFELDNLDCLFSFPLGGFSSASLRWPIFGGVGRDVLDYCRLDAGGHEVAALEVGREELGLLGVADVLGLEGGDLGGFELVVSERLSHLGAVAGAIALASPRGTLAVVLAAGTLVGLATVGSR